MSQKSTVVPLGIIMRNENKLDQMCLIADDLAKYCPIHVEDDAKVQLKDGRTVNHRIAKAYEILFGGDQLTCARVRGAQSLRKKHDGVDHQLKCFVPCVEDWYSRLTLVTEIWDRMFNKKSQIERGTLYQFRNLLNLSSLPKEPKANMKSCKDFLTVVLHGLLKAAAKRVMVDTPRPIEDINELSEAIVSKFINIDKPSLKKDDDVHLYTTEPLALLLVWHNYHDSVREGDGDRVMDVWKFLLVIFKKSGRKNYSIEALTLLLHYHFLLSDRMAQQLKWSRFVNMQGRQGCNIPCDLHLEHLNRRFKGSLRRVGSNLQATTVSRLGRSIGAVHSTEAEFVRLLKYSSSNVHNRPSCNRDVEMVASVLEQIKAFQYIENRSFSASSGFKNKKPMLDVIDKDDKIIDWMVERSAPLIF